MADLGICEVSYIAAGYQGVEIPGPADKDFVTQARNAELVDRCERYLLGGNYGQADHGYSVI